ncbi:MAG: Diaminopimelate epimerase [Candidatus Anoxychlamydiales bacterium]|nr:Diaminopimelate epimerase [Candidatus Anoxychlamydiales bacterium]
MLDFFKYNSNGNDFIILDNRKFLFDDLLDKPEIIQKLCKKEFAIGADGIIFLHLSNTADYKMQIFNSDGYLADMCGNALLCLVKFINDHIKKQRSLMIETKACVYETFFDKKQVSFRSKYPQVINENMHLDVDGNSFDLQLINSGVLHGVIFIKNIENIDVFKLGKKIRNFKQFLPGINVNFCEIINETEIKVRVYEKGVENETLCCSTGALATAYSYFLLKDKKIQRKYFLRKKNLRKNFLQKVFLQFIGGKIQIEFEKDHMLLTGLPNFAYKGQVLESL